MMGTILVGAISVVAFLAGVPLIPLLIFVLRGTCLEYFWLRKQREKVKPK